MPFTFGPQSSRRVKTRLARIGFPASVADEIAYIETIDRHTLWSTLRIRACLQLRCESPRTEHR